ncbi:unnamed protein product, partial [Didymodactylos carnosus]
MGRQRNHLLPSRTTLYRDRKNNLDPVITKAFKDLKQVRKEIRTTTTTKYYSQSEAYHPMDVHNETEFRIEHEPDSQSQEAGSNSMETDDA